MCGITGYVGKKEGLPIVFANLKKLEYRGYDSAGVAFFNNDEEQALMLVKAAGKLENLKKAITGRRAAGGAAAIAHTRWATHGAPTHKNAHPHTDCTGAIAVVHNGIIENDKELRDALMAKGHRFSSETDTEVIAHLIEEYGFEKAFTKIVGAYALAVVRAEEPEKLYVARLGSPLVVGVGAKEYYVASDPTALAGLVKKVVYLKDGQRGYLSLAKMAIGPTRPAMEKLDIDPARARKGNFPHFMMKEIHEGPAVVAAAMRGRLFQRKHFVKLGGLEDVAPRLGRIAQIEILACGTSYYAGLVGARLFEEIAGIPARVFLASEYRYTAMPALPNTASLFISQSGETADTLAALRTAQERGHLTLGIVNAVGSSIARETDAGVYNHAGPEIGVASTKAFLSQLTVLALMALRAHPHATLMCELARIPKKIEAVLAQKDAIQRIAKKYAYTKSMLYLGRGYDYPTALEGALKLKEISYIHAEGYAGGEMKHGPIALIEKTFPAVVIATHSNVYGKMLSNMEEIKARGGPILAIATEGDTKVRRIADDVIYVPKTAEALAPMVNIVPLQLFAYCIGVARGYDVDKPRNLAKSVTVE